MKTLLLIIYLTLSFQVDFIDNRVVEISFESTVCFENNVAEDFELFEAEDYILSEAKFLSKSSCLNRIIFEHNFSLNDPFFNSLDRPPQL